MIGYGSGDTEKEHHGNKQGLDPEAGIVLVFRYDAMLRRSSGVLAGVGPGALRSMP